MSRFVLDVEKNFDHTISDVPKTGCTLEIRKIDKLYYSIFQHYKDSVYEAGTFTKEELKAIWQMLSAE
jgi:hypothetical protein